MLANFQNYFTVVFSRKFETKPMPHCLTFLRCIAEKNKFSEGISVFESIIRVQHTIAHLIPTSHVEHQ